MKLNDLVPEFDVRDLKTSLHFYLEILGFKIAFDRPESNFAYLEYHESQIMLSQIKEPADDDAWVTGPRDYPLGRGMHLQIYTPSIAPILKRMKDENISVFRGPYETWYPVKDKLEGTKEFLIQDPDGYLIRMQEDLGARENVEGFTTSQHKKI